MTKKEKMNDFVARATPLWNSLSPTQKDSVSQKIAGDKSAEFCELMMNVCKA
jgi:hypothetical protein